MMTFQTQKTPILTPDINPVEILEWRDPFVWRENDVWYLILGGSRNGYGVVILYTSPDLNRWRYVGILHEDRKHSLCECPNLLMFEKRRVWEYCNIM